MFFSITTMLLTSQPAWQTFLVGFLEVTELLVPLVTPTFHHIFSIQLGSSTITPSTATSCD